MYHRDGGFHDTPQKDYTSVAPPENINKRQSYTSVTQITQQAFDYSTKTSRKRAATDDDYFDDDDEGNEGAYQPAPGSPGVLPDSTSADDDEEDPLDAFMANLDKETKKVENKKVSKVPTMKEVKKAPEAKGIRDDIEGEDLEESYYRYMEENPNAGIGTFAGGSDDEDIVDAIEYDADGNPIAPARSRNIDPLPPIYHSEIEYEPFEKNFYNEHEEISKLVHNEVAELRKTLGIQVSGAVAPKPVTSFAHFGFDEILMKAIRKSEYVQPTPIQAQGIPVALSGRDIIGIAKTGSGKTAAFIWPMLVHVMDQRDLKESEGPIGLILAPTRELALQIYTEAKKFGKIYNIEVVCAYGGGNKYEQSKDLANGAEIVVATPGRMIDMVKMKATNLQRVTYLVLDEADRMFDMGFEPQVRSICNHVRPDRQTLLFSATFKKRIEKLARDILTDPIKVVQGEVGEANESVTQFVHVFDSGPFKWEWLLSHLVDFTSSGSVLIFVTKKANCEELAENLKTKDFNVVVLHGDMDQADRNKVITSFKKKEASILVATDVAARGLDIPHIKTVINYDIARDIDTHTHRIGRTGRAGEIGNAYTLVTEKDKEFAGHLVRNLEGANQVVPSKLMDLAMQSAWFKKSRFKHGSGKKMNIGGAGLGFKKQRLGLGATVSL